MAFIWATSYPLGRWLGVYEAPEAIVVSRVFIAFLFLCLVARVRNEPSIPFMMPVWIQLFVLGFFGFCIHNYLMFAALEHTEAGKGAIINGAIPAIVMILNYLFYQQKITLLSLIGVILSFSGVVLVVTEGKIYNLLNFHINKFKLYKFHYIRNPNDLKVQIIDRNIYHYICYSYCQRV